MSVEAIEDVLAKVDVLVKDETQLARENLFYQNQKTNLLDTLNEASIVTNASITTNQQRISILDAQILELTTKLTYNTDALALLNESITMATDIGITVGELSAEIATRDQLILDNASDTTSLQVLNDKRTPIVNEVAEDTLFLTAITDRIALVETVGQPAPPGNEVIF